VNAEADVAEGFIWRLVGDGDANDAIAIEALAGDARLHRKPLGLA